jgi:hypothetical protein
VGGTEGGFREGVLKPPAPVLGFMPDDMRRFVSKISPEPMSGCWLWTGAIGDKGCGGFGVSEAGKKRTLLAHRISWAAFVGPIPTGLQLDHKCRVRCCVNPDHLEPVTPRENQRRGNAPSGLNARRTHCVHGHELSGANLYVRPDNGNRCCVECGRRRKSLNKEKVNATRRALYHRKRAS